MSEDRNERRSGGVVYLDDITDGSEEDEEEGAAADELKTEMTAHFSYHNQQVV